MTGLQGQGRRGVGFEYDGEMSAAVVLDPELMALYPFCHPSGPANVLIMPALHTASIGSELLQQLGGGTVIGGLAWSVRPWWFPGGGKLSGGTERWTSGCWPRSWWASCRP